MTKKELAFSFLSTATAATWMKDVMNWLLRSAIDYIPLHGGDTEQPKTPWIISPYDPNTKHNIAHHLRSKSEYPSHLITSTWILGGGGMNLDTRQS